MAEDRVTIRIQRTLQVVDFEPIVYSVEHSVTREHGKSVEETRDRCHREAIRGFRQVQNEVVEAFGLDSQVELSGPPKRPAKKKSPPKRWY